jgi:trans-aconitate methyltransferase
VPDLKITGVDLAPAMLAIAREAVPQGEFRYGDIRKLDPSEGPCDAILAANISIRIKKT